MIIPEIHLIFDLIFDLILFHFTFNFHIGTTPHRGRNLLRSKRECASKRADRRVGGFELRAEPRDLRRERPALLLAPRELRPELKGSVGEGPNQTNYSDRSSVRILGQNSFKIQDFSLENSKNWLKFGKN